MKKTFTIQFMLRASIGLLLIALCSVNARAQETISINGNDYPILSGFTATAYQQGDNTWNNQEGYKKLVDGNKGSKWLSSNETNWLDLYIEFNYSTAFVPKGYLLTTGNDTESHPNRNPKNWVLKGKLQLTDEWTTIASVTNDDRLTATNTTDVLFELSDNTSPYRYFRFEITATQGSETSTNGRTYWMMQLSELQFFGTTKLPQYNTFKIACSPNVSTHKTTFTITRSGDKSKSETVKYHTVSLSALAGKHFTAKDGSLNFGVNDSIKTVVIDEIDVADVDLRYRYQNTDYRSYRLEITDQGGFELAHCDREIDYSDPYKFTNAYVSKDITDLVYFNGSNYASGLSSDKYIDLVFDPHAAYYSSQWVVQSGDFAGYILIDDSYDYGERGIVFKTDALAAATGAPQEYHNLIGNKMYATFCFTEKEKDDGYAYIQIVGGDLNDDYDEGADPNGEVYDPVNSLYKACFELKKGSGVYSGEGKQFFPHRYDYHDRREGSQTASHTEFFLSEGYLWQQKFKENNPSYRAPHSGSLVLDPTLRRLTVRFDCGGSGDDTFGFKDFFWRLAMADDTAPTKDGDPIVASGGYNAQGTSVFISVPFSEIVVVTGTPKLQTTWNTSGFSYYSGSGSNVLTFKGTITASQGTQLVINGITGGSIKDQAGNAFTGGSFTKTYGNIVRTSREYLISYDLHEGVVSQANPTSYTYETPAFTLNNPTRTGYDFVGWTGTNSYAAQTTLTIVHSHGNHHFIANYSPHTYTVHFDANDNNNGIEGTMEDQSFVYDEAQNLNLNAFTINQDGWAFVEWNTEPDGSGTSYPDGKLVNNLTAVDNGIITLYAQWADVWGIGNGADGSREHPYIITTPAGLNLLSTLCNSGSISGRKHFELGNDIEYHPDAPTLDNDGDGVRESNYTPIGHENHRFSGYFDGKGYTISGIRIYRGGNSEADYYLGVFGYVDALNSEVSNLTLTDTQITGYYAVGGIMGFGMAYTYNCHVTNTVHLHAIHDQSRFFGGIVGNKHAGVIESCTSAVQITTEENITVSSIGGIVGAHWYGGYTKDCLVFGASIPSSGSVGAIAGSYQSTSTDIIRNYYHDCTPGIVGVGQSGNWTVLSNDISGARQVFSLTLGTGLLATRTDGEATINGAAMLYDDGFTTGNTEYYIQNATVTLEPAPGCNIISVSYTPEGESEATALEPVEGVYTLTMPDKNVTVDVVLASVSLTVEGHHGGAGKWAFIASPVTDDLAPLEISGMIPTDSENYDLYQFNQNAEYEWENYKNPDHTEDFVIVNGQGYLYANQEEVTLTFVGPFNMDEEKTVALNYNENVPFAGYNLVGNPFTVPAYVDRPFYRMNDAGTGIEPVENYSSYVPTTIPACTGIIVQATEEGEHVTFSRTAPANATGDKGSLDIVLTQATTRGETMLDKAIVSFNDSQLGKFYFGTQDANLYIPQGNKEYAIAYAGNQTEMPLNFKAKENGTYTLTVSETFHSPLSTLHLIDHLTGADIDLLQTPSYTFNARTSDYASRFKLVFNANSTENNDDFAFIDDAGNIVINGTGTLQVFDILGHELFRKELSTFHSPLSTFRSPGVYVLRLMNGDQVKTQKIVIK